MLNLFRLAKSAQMTLVAAGYSGTATIATATLLTLITARQAIGLRLTGLSTVSGTNTIINLAGTPVVRKPQMHSHPDNP